LVNAQLIGFVYLVFSVAYKILMFVIVYKGDLSINRFKYLAKTFDYLQMVRYFYTAGRLIVRESRRFIQEHLEYMFP
jgi:hypothetical protein